MPLPDLIAPVVNSTFLFWDGYWLPRHLIPQDIGYPYGFEDWRKVGGAGQPAYGNTWADFVGATYGVYFKRTPDGKVKIIGSASGTPATNATIFTLPVGYRPTKTIYLTTTIGGGVGVISVDAAGAVKTINLVIGTSPNYGTVHMDTIEFRAEA